MFLNTKKKKEKMNIFKKALIAAAVVSAASFLSLSASEFGSVYYAPRIPLSDDLTYTKLYAHNEDNGVYNTGFLFEYDPASSQTLPLVSSGGSIYGKKTANELVSYKVRSRSRLAAAINADFFSFQTGVPMGVIVENGLVFSGTANKNAFVIGEDGRAYITEAELDFTLTKEDGQSTPIGYFNKYPTVYGSYLLSPSYSESTHSSFLCREIVLCPQNGGGYIGTEDEITAVVTEVREDAKNGPIPSGCFVLVYAPDGFEANNEVLASLEEGDTVTIASSNTGLDGNVRLAVGGGDIILKDGEYDPSLCDEEHEETRNPRTAAGIRADGSVVFFACDGRRPGYASGLTLEGLSEQMKALGCVDAINLDGGGSTTVIVGYGGEYFTANRPTDGSQREIASALMLVNTEEYTEQMKTGALTVTPKTSAVLAGGSSVALEVRFGDEIIEKEDLSFALSDPNAGWIEDGCFVSGGRAAQTYVTAFASVGGRYLTGVCDISVVDSLTGLEIVLSSDEENRIGAALKGSLYNAAVEVSAQAAEWSSDRPADTERSEDCLCVTELGVLGADALFVPAEGAEGEVTLYAEIGGVSASASFAISSGSDQPLLPEIPGDPLQPEHPFEPEILFADTEGHWAENYISQAAALGYVNGSQTENGLCFLPDDVLTRAQLAKLCCTFSGISPDGAEEHVFTDAALIPEWAKGYINAAVSAGLMNGKAVTENGEITFDPDSGVTRAEAMQVLGRMLGEGAAASLDGFTDRSEIPLWAEEMIGRMVGSGIVGGYPDGTIRPSRTVTRAEMCKMLVTMRNFSI